MRSLRQQATLAALLACLCLLALAAAPGPAAGDSAEPLRFAVVGDSGTGDKYQRLIAQRMTEWHDRLPYGLVLMLGDNIYGGLFGLGGGNQKDFEEKFDQPYAQLLRRGVVFRATLGNHDMRGDDGAHLIRARERFHIDGPQGYYRFTAGEWFPAAGAAGLNKVKEEVPLVEFFVLNTVRVEEDKQDPQQLAWLKQALAASRARWKIVYGHHPLYSSARRHGSDERLRQKLAPLLHGGDGNEPRAEVVLAGHDHIYQRFHPQQGIAYFVCGSSGKLRRGNAEPSPLVAAVEDRQRTFMLWEATPEELRFRAINEQGQAFDCGVIERDGSVEQQPCPALDPESPTARP